MITPLRWFVSFVFHPQIPTRTFRNAHSGSRVAHSAATMTLILRVLIRTAVEVSSPIPCLLSQLLRAFCRIRSDAESDQTRFAASGILCLRDYLILRLRSDSVTALHFFSEGQFWSVWFCNGSPLFFWRPILIGAHLFVCHYNKRTPRMGVEPTTFRFEVWRAIHCATEAYVRLCKWVEHYSRILWRTVKLL